MGPIALFDKSFLQLLTLDEACVFDALFSANIPPIFLAEVLADLAKAGKSSGQTKRFVASLAEKTPCLHSYPNAFHFGLMRGELIGLKVEMSGRPHIHGGQFARSNKGIHIIHEKPPEMEALNRWEDGQFDYVEALFAKQWREQIEQIDLKEVAARVADADSFVGKIRNLSDARTRAEEYLNNPQHQISILKLLIEILGFGSVRRRNILDRWTKSGRAPMSKFAPYCLYVLTVDIFFELALGKSMIGAHRPSNKIDMSYLYYLPFCQIFVSRDKLHKRVAPLFLRGDQEFVWGDDLKSSLFELVGVFSTYPESIKETGLMKFARTPPIEHSGAVTQLWDNHIERWKDKLTPPVLDPRKEKEILDMLKSQMGLPRLTSTQISTADMRAEPQSMAISRMIPRKKGQWYMLPKGIK